MKKEKLTTRIKDWVKDYYSFVIDDLKTSKSMNAMSWVLLGLCSTVMFASLSLYGAGAAFIISCFAVFAEACDCVVNFSKGNTSSYLARGIMTVCATAFMPVIAICDAVATAVENKKEQKIIAEQLSDEDFESLKSNNLLSQNNSNELEVLDKENTSLRNMYNENTKTNKVVETNDDLIKKEINPISIDEDNSNDGNDGNEGM